jgi:hypothetical protein
MNIIDKLTMEMNSRFTNWAFRGSIVDWYYLNGQVIIKDFDVVTSDSFEPDRVCPFWGPRKSWTFMGKEIDLFFEENPGPTMQTVEDRVAKLHWMVEHYPHRQEKYQLIIDKYSRLQPRRIEQPTPPTQPTIISKSCPQRSKEPVRLMTSDLCGSRGKDLPVYSCSIHGECTHGKVCKAQDPSVKICIGCEDGPWSP